MQKLRVIGNSYYNDRRRTYKNFPISNEELKKVLEFSYDMCFGNGHHRQYRTGGTLKRRAGEQFCNTFQGKLAEVVLRRHFIDNGYKCAQPDFNVYGEGIWDDTDLIIRDKSLSVKSAAFFSNLLLLETHDYDNKGQYLPNLNIGATALYDYYILVRIAPDIKGEFRKKRLLYSDNIEIDTIESIISKQDWSYDIAGWISKQEFVSIIDNNFILPQKALLNGKTPMDAENYYAQSGDMHEIEELYKEF